MPITPSPKQSTPSLVQRILGGFLISRLGDIVAKNPIGGRLITATTRRLVRSQTGQIAKQPSPVRPTVGASQISEDHIAQADLEATLKFVVTAVVDAMGYVAALVATYEPDDSLQVRAYYADPNVATEQRIEEWESQLTEV